MTSDLTMTMAPNHQPSDRLSCLPAEMILEIASYLPVQGIVDLKRVNRSLHASISLSSIHLSKPIIKRQLARLQKEFQYFNFAGMRLDTALRRYTAQFGEDLFLEFALLYWRSSPDMFSRWDDFLVVLNTLSIIDGSFGSRMTLKLFMSGMGLLLPSAPSNILSAVEEATRNHIGAYDSLLFELGWHVELMGGSREFIRIFEEIRRRPLIHAFPTVRSFEDGVDFWKLPRYLIIRMTQRIWIPTLGLPFHIGLSDMLPGYRRSRLLSEVTAGDNGLAWAALLEEVVIKWEAE